MWSPAGTGRAPTTRPRTSSPSRGRVVDARARSGGPPPARPCRGPPGCPARRRRRRAAPRRARRPSRRRGCTVTGPTARTPSSHVPGRVGHERAADRGPRTSSASMPVGRRLVPVPRQPVRRAPSAAGAGGVAELDGEVAADGRQVLGDRAARLERDVEPAACSASSGPRPWSGRTRALPPPCGRPYRAYGPISATRRAVAGSGSSAAVVLQQHHRPGRGPPDDRIVSPGRRR